MELVSFSSFTPEAEREETKVLNSISGEMYTPRQGRNHVRVLPAVDGRVSPFRKVFVHWTEAYDDDGKMKRLSFVCNKKTHGGTCIACDYIQSLVSSKTRTPMEEEIIKELDAQLSVYAIVVDMMEEDKIPRIMRFPPGLHKTVNELAKQPTGLVDFAHPVTGRSISFIRKGEGMNTRYSALAFDMEKSPIASLPDGSPDVATINSVLLASPPLDRQDGPANQEQLQLALNRVSPFSEKGKRLLAEGVEIKQYRLVDGSNSMLTSGAAKDRGVIDVAADDEIDWA